MQNFNFGVDDNCAPDDQKQAYLESQNTAILEVFKSMARSCECRETNLLESQKKVFQQVIKNMAHACECRGENCNRPASCWKLKRLIQHVNTCTQKSDGHCPICRRLVILSCYHAKSCLDTKCVVPFCATFKIKFKQQQLQQKLKRYMTTMRNRELSSVVLQGSSGNSDSSSHQSPVAQSPQPEIGITSLSPPSVDVLLAETVLHTVTADYGKGNLINPLAVNAGLKNTSQQIKIQKPIFQTMPGISDVNMGDVAFGESSDYLQPHQSTLSMPSPLNLRQPTKVMERIVPSSIRNLTMIPQVIHNPIPSLENMKSPTQEWQQLLAKMSDITLATT